MEQPSADVTHEDNLEHHEAREELLALAHGRTGAIPGPRIVDHVLAVTAGGDWPVQRGALEAILRRLRFAGRDELRVSTHPPARRVLGRYETRRRGSKVRPYAVELSAVEPLRGSCSCPDFLRSSLGLCKHLLVALEHVFARPRRLTRALKEQERAAPAPRWRLVWDPVRPLTGAGDWAERLRWIERPRGNQRETRTVRAARRWFAASASGALRPADVFSGDAATRMDMIDDLLIFCRADARRCRRNPAAAAAAEPAVLPLLLRERALLDQSQVCRAVDPLEDQLGSLKQPLYPYQLEGVQRFLSRGQLLLADDMGLGKTVQAIAACLILWREGLVRRGLLVVPASLKFQWLREWQGFSDLPACVVEGSPARRAETYARCDEGFLIVNYEQVIRDLALMHDWRPGLMVLDEAQRIKNWATKTATYIKQLRPPFRLVLTGTPMENRLDELASIMDWVDDMALEPKWRLGPWHLTRCDGRREISGARNLDTLRARLAPVMTRRVRQEVLDQLPPRTDSRIPVAFTPAQRDEHDALKQPIVRLMRQARRRPLIQAEFFRLMSLLAAQRIISNGMAQQQFTEIWPGLEQTRPTGPQLAGLNSPKLLELRELVSQLVITQRRKVVIFSQWRRMLQLARWAVADLLDQAHVRAVFFTGHEGLQRRTQNIVDFHDDPATLLLLSSDAGGVGLNLQHAASCLINLELPWNPAVLEQRVGRIYRLGQKRPIQVYHLVNEEGIESRIEALVADKKALFTGLFDGDSDEVKFARTGSFLKQVERLIDPAEPVPLGAAEELDPEPMDDLTGLSAPGPTSEEAAEREVSPAVDGSVPAAAGAPAPLAPGEPGAEQVARLLSRIEVRRTPAGGVTIEAPPEAAATLSAMFDGMARMLAAAAAPPEGRR